LQRTGFALSCCLPRHSPSSYLPSPSAASPATPPPTPHTLSVCALWRDMQKYQCKCPILPSRPEIPLENLTSTSSPKQEQAVSNQLKGCDVMQEDNAIQSRCPFRSRLQSRHLPQQDVKICINHNKVCALTRSSTVLGHHSVQNVPLRSCASTTSTLTPFR